MKKPIIYIGSDHGGFDQKTIIKKWLQNQEYQVEDIGAHQFDKDDDYPQFGFAVAQRVVELNNQITQPLALGILICRSSAGITIAANKITGARAVSVFDVTSAVHAREHNDANIIAVSGDWTSAEQAQEIIKVFLTTEFQNKPRHVRRIAQISKFEQEN
jgi:ribose 5-phosphate isomerase B